MLYGFLFRGLDNQGTAHLRMLPETASYRKISTKMQQREHGKKLTNARRNMYQWLLILKYESSLFFSSFLHHISQLFVFGNEYVGSLHDKMDKYIETDLKKYTVFDACNETLINLVQRWNEDLVNRVALLSVFWDFSIVYWLFISRLQNYQKNQRRKTQTVQLFVCVHHQD